MLNTLRFFTQDEHLLKIGKLLYHWRKFVRAAVQKIRTRYVKEIDRNMFDGEVVLLMEALGQDWKYGKGTVSGYESMGGRVCNRHQKIFN